MLWRFYEGKRKSPVTCGGHRVKFEGGIWCPLDGEWLLRWLWGRKGARGKEEHLSSGVGGRKVVVRRHVPLAGGGVSPSPPPCSFPLFARAR